MSNQDSGDHTLHINSDFLFLPKKEREEAARQFKKGSSKGGGPNLSQKNNNDAPFEMSDFDEEDNLIQDLSDITNSNGDY